MVGDLQMGGGGKLIAFVCVNRDEDTIMPCGRCRQLLLEHGGPELILDTASGPRSLAELLPDAFGPDDLARVAAEKEQN